MPFRFARIPGVDGKVLVTSEVGEFEFLEDRQIVEAIEERNRVEGRVITFSMTSTLHQVDGEVLEFLRPYDFQLPTHQHGSEALCKINGPRSIYVCVL
ncbi:hypothetical protein DM194_14865 (plasmid) [Azospirillum ramasamyi]|uniref:Uncharacterized protein n=2 Tax=Azospirillum ramasamyi TaxID=682998 RepID=A0A2U9S850_9PROT|nr:hypothetical protein DM194_14865 [Azospirillum ramasamyi]